jgi:hypothetical protein
MTEINAPKVECLKDLIDYQDGSVVCREIIRKSTGTATLRLRQGPGTERAYRAI